MTLCSKHEVVRQVSLREVKAGGIPKGYSTQKSAFWTSKTLPSLEQRLEACGVTDFTSYNKVYSVFTCMAENSSVCWQPTVTVKATGSLHTAALVLAERAIAAAVTRAAGSNPGCDFCPLLQVQGDAVQLQRADTSTKALLPGRCASWKHLNKKKIAWHF